MRRLILSAGALALAVLATPLAAQTLAQKEVMADQDKVLADKLPDFDKTCGTSLKASIDWPSFFKGELRKDRVANYCAEALGAMRTMCSSAAAKQAIGEKVKAFTCGYGGPGKRALSLENGTLHLDLDWTAANYGEFITAWLGDHL